jgi:AsmA protein
MNQIKSFKWAMFKKPLKVSAIIVGAFFLLLFIVPFFFTDGMVTKVKVLANKNLNGEVNFSDVNLSFYRHFPLLTLTLEDFLMKGSEPYKNDTLISAKGISLGVNLKSLFGQAIQINKIFLENAFINVQVDENGLPNYNVYGGNETVDSTQLLTDTAADDTKVKISEIIIRNTRLIYNDRSLVFQMEAKGLDYTGSGDLSKSVFDLNSRAHIKSLDLYYDKVPYLLSKEIDADLITKINTSTLAFLFERNDLKINQLPVRFTGRFEFLENGYDMEFLLTSDNTGLRELFTAMPPEYLTWLEKTVVTGEANISASLAGKYISETNIMPDLKLDLSVKNGFIQHESAPAPVENLFVKFQTVIPGFNPDSLSVNMDSVHFNIEKDYYLGG